MTAASGRAIRLGVDGGYFEPIVDEATKGGDGEGGCAQKYDSHDGARADSSTGSARNAIPARTL